MIDHTGVVVSNFEKSKDFYVQVLSAIGYSLLADIPASITGHKRDDMRKGLRIINYKKRTVIAFSVDAELVSVIGIFYGGQDHEARLSKDSDDELAY